MHLGLAGLGHFFAAHRDRDALVLATVIGIQGSSYRKPGAMMLIAPGGSYAGMISGGCLEDDLLLHADAVLSAGGHRFVRYETQADAEPGWGLGLGCEGVIHLLLKRLDRSEDFGFLPWLFAALKRRRACVLALVTGPEGAGLEPGSFALIDRDGERCGEAKLDQVLAEHVPPWHGGGRHRAVALEIEGRPLEVLLVQVSPPPRVLVLGAGPDALPLSRLAAELGWECFVVDHRPAYARAERFPAATAVRRLAPAALAGELDLSEVDAAVVMTHNLERDRAYLEPLLAAGVPYLGLLGPSARRRRIEQDLDCPPGRIPGPVGLDIGAELPESIALATVAEIHAALNARAGGMLSRQHA